MKVSLLVGIDKNVSLAYLTSIYNLSTLLLSLIKKTHQPSLALQMHLSFSKSLFFLLSKAFL